MLPRLPLLACAGVLSACVSFDRPEEPDDDEPDETTGTISAPIIGGTVASGDNAVVAVRIGGALCTGSLIAPRVVMTAAHCVEEPIREGRPDSGTVQFGNGQDAEIAEIDIVDMAMHRLYEPPAFLAWDIAAVRLAEDAPDTIPPLEPNFDPLDPDQDIGLEVRAVGFGVEDGQSQTGAGIKREVLLTIDEITYFHIGMGGESENTCQGDSGGPSFAVLGGEERIVGVTSFGNTGCVGRSFQTRVDSMQDWLRQVIDAWSGPCQLDGTCVTEGCSSIDPDCDECGFEGSCGTDCEAVDLDCPVGERIGDLCGDRFDCESRLCLPAVDDPRILFCTATCDPERPVETCPPPLSTCIDGPEGEPVCAYSGPTRSAQGASCDQSGDCRSGFCDTTNSICVEECGDGLPECPEPYSCQEAAGTRLCRPGGDGGGCRAAPSPGGWLGSALLALVALLLRKRGHLP